MKVKELKELLNEFDDNLIVMMPNEKQHVLPESFWCVPVTDVYQGVNESDGCVFIDNSYGKCESCVYYGTDIDDQPCCSCSDGENWEMMTDG